MKLTFLNFQRTVSQVSSDSEDAVSDGPSEKF